MLIKFVTFAIAYEITLWSFYFLAAVVNRYTLSNTKANTIARFVEHLCLTFTIYIPIMLVVLGAILALIFLLADGVNALITMVGIS